MMATRADQDLTAQP